MPMTKSEIPNPKPQTPNWIIGHWSLVILLLCTVAVVPLLRSDSPCSHDGAFHYFRVTAMRHALQTSTQPLRSAFTRYLPDLAFGYGYPFFNYRAALSYYLALALHLAGLALPLALNLVYVLSIAGSALTAYLLARDLFGPRAGVVAAIAYAYAPYQFLDALLRANMPESVALPLFPLILWAFRRLALTGERRWFLASVGSLATLLLTHNISSLLFAPFLLAYLATLWLVYRQRGHWLAVGGAFALAFGLIAFFLGPALLEQGYAQLHMSRVTRNNDFHYNFLPLAEIFAPPAPVDTSLMNPPMRVHLGLVQAIVGGLGLVVGLIRWRDRERRATLVFLAITAIGLIWMSTRGSLWLWEHVPLMPFIQFPWRLVGRAILPVSLLSGALIPAISPPTQHATRNTGHASRITHHVSRTTYYVLLPILILSAFPYTYPPRGYCPNAARPTIDDVFAYEHRAGLVGVDPEGSYFPVWVKRRPEGSPLEPQYAAGAPITRFDEAVLPSGATVVEADYGSNRARLLIETPVPFQARYLAFYFPGWQVSIDGEPVDVTPTDPEGLMAFDVPSGKHTIIVRFGSTPIRSACTGISLLSIMVLVALVLCYSRVVNPKSQTPNSKPQSRRSIVRDWPLLAIAVCLLAFKLAVVDRTDTLFRRPALQPDGALPGLEHPLNQPYADGLMLVGYDQGQTILPADGTLRVDLYWTARARPTARYQTVIHLVGPDGLRWSMPDSFRPRGYAKYPPTNGWSPDRYALDSHEIESLPGTPPGTYEVVLTTFDRDTLAPLSLLNEQDQPAAPTLTLGQVTLTAPRHPADPDALGISHQTDASLGSITLLGADFDRREAAPGDAVLLNTFWRADRQPAQDLTVHLALLAQDGSPVAGYDLPPTARWHPTSAWQPGDVWRGQHVLNIPADLDSGDYTWQLSIEPPHQFTSLPSALHVIAPDRTFSSPPVDVQIDARMGNVATLVGANLKPETSNLKPGNPLTVTLVWRAEDTPPASYHVFLHLLGPDGTLVAQSDGVPAGWSRPTTGWMPGEYITDVHTLSIPPDALEGDHILSTGLYLPGGARLTTPDGADAIRLTIIQVETQ
jgi:hypothetical protein